MLSACLRSRAMLLFCELVRIVGLRLAAYTTEVSSAFESGQFLYKIKRDDLQNKRSQVENTFLGRGYASGYDRCDASGYGRGDVTYCGF